MSAVFHATSCSEVVQVVSWQEGGRTGEAETGAGCAFRLSQFTRYTLLRMRNRQRAMCEGNLCVIRLFLAFLLQSESIY